MTDNLQIGAWLPNEWGRTFTENEKSLIADSEIDLLLVPENHDQWANRRRWKQLADDLDVALYAGFEDGEWIRGIFYDPTTETDFTYTKHSTAGRLALEQDDWNPTTALRTTEFRGTTVGTTICHDQYISPFMGYESLVGASLLVNLSARPVVPKKWGEVLQARAIENGAYVVCTMHGTEPDGSTKQGNKAHVFAFDPFGEPLRLTELATGDRRGVFETTPDNIYTFEADQKQAVEARRTLTDQEARPSITRIQDSTSESGTLSDPWVGVKADYPHLRITYNGDSIEIVEFESQSITLKDEMFYLAAIEGKDILKPEQLYRDLLQVTDIENKRILLFNHWSDLNSQYHRNVVEPVLRARCVEWASPAILVAPEIESAYQAWYAKNTSRMLPDSDGQYRFYLYAARGVSSAFEPVHHETEKLAHLASVCESQRIESD